MLIARYDKAYRRFQTLREHSAKVAEKTAESLRSCGLFHLGLLVGWMHDLYKSANVWQEALDKEKQKCLKNGGKEKRHPLDVPHAPPSAQLFYNLFKKELHTDISKLLLQLSCIAVYAHHGYLMDALTVDGIDKYRKDICEKSCAETTSIQSYFYEVVSQDMLEAYWNKAYDEVLAITKKCNAACGHLIDRDKRIAAKYFLYGMIARTVYSAMIDADRLDAANFESGIVESESENSKPDWNKLLILLENHINGLNGINDISLLRRTISNQAKAAAEDTERICLLAAPTGAGKTLAGLRFALARARNRNHKRIFYIVSYTTILDQVYQEYEEIFKKSQAPVKMLLHHSNIISDMNDEDTENKKSTDDQDIDEYRKSYSSELVAERWDADIILTTQVQFFNALFLGTGKAARRLQALKDAVIIIDEVQTIPVKLIHLLNLAVTYLASICNCDILLSTATQPTLHELEYPLPPAKKINEATDDIFRQMKRVIIHDERYRGSLDSNEIADFVFEQQAKWTSVLIVLNTRSAARKIFEAIIQKNTPGIEVLLLSNDLCPAHRNVILTSLRQRQGMPVICVSTQLVECGVDISLGCAIRSMAGADNIMQTAGRCNRHDEYDIRPVYIIKSADESLDKLPDIDKAQRAYLNVYMDSGNADDLQKPSWMDCYYKYYYHLQGMNLSYNIKAGSDDVYRNTTILNLLSCNQTGIEALRENNLPPPMGPLHQAFSAAGKRFNVIEDEQRGLIVPYGPGKELIRELSMDHPPNELIRLLRQAQHYSINVYQYRFAKLFESGSVFQLTCGAYALAEDLYDEGKRGLLDTPLYNPERYMV